MSSPTLSMCINSFLFLSYVSINCIYPPDNIKKGLIEIDRNENWDFRTEKACYGNYYSLLTMQITFKSFQIFKWSSYYNSTLNIIYIAYHQTP